MDAEGAVEGRVDGGGDERWAAEFVAAAGLLERVGLDGLTRLAGYGPEFDAEFVEALEVWWAELARCEAEDVRRVMGEAARRRGKGRTA